MKIRSRRFKRLKGIRYEADFGIVNGKRLSRLFKTKVAAETWANEMGGKLKKHGSSAVALSEDERITFQAARDRLAAAGATINDAVDFYFEKHKPLKESVSLRRLLELCLDDMRLTGKSSRYLQQFPSSCRSFIRGKEDRPARSVTRDEIKAWILGNGFAPKTQRVYLGDLRTLFSWGAREKYLPLNPIAGEEGFIELAPEMESEITCFEVKQCQALLRTALMGRYMTFDRAAKVFRHEHGFRPLLGFLALAMFIGVRPNEIRKTTVREMDLRERVIIVTARAAKTNAQRVIELPRVAVAWLRLWRKLCPDQVNLIPQNFDRKWKALRKEANILLWPHDILRHTAASFDYAVHQNTAGLKAKLGHSENEDTLFRHYRAVRTLSGRMVTKKMGEEFLSLMPRKVRLG